MAHLISSMIAEFQESSEQQSLGNLETIENLEEEILELQTQNEELEARVYESLSLTVDAYMASSALAISNGDVKSAHQLLTEQLFMTANRAKSAINSSIEFLEDDSQNLPTALFGWDIHLLHWTELKALDFLFNKGSTSSICELPLSTCLESIDQLFEIAGSNNPLNNFSTLLFLAGVAAGFDNPESELSKKLEIDPETQNLAELSDLSKFSLFAFSLYCAQSGRLRKNLEPWPSRSTHWLHGAPWLLPLIDSEKNTAVDFLIYSLEIEARSYTRPGTRLFPHHPSESWLESIRNTASMVSNNLQRRPNLVKRYKSNRFEILLCEDSDFVYAWVGTKGEGILVSFDNREFNVLGLPDCSQRLAAGIAISFYIDCCVQTRAEIPMLRRVKPSIMSERNITHFSPERSFGAHAESVRTGRITPPTAHWVAAHVRNLGRGRPNPAHVLAAPRRLRSRMGPHHTWVQAHSRGGGKNLNEVTRRLMYTSMLADAIGTLDH